jgi:SAM-dependent methyltransferase
MIPGERQVAPTVQGIRRDHVARYEFAARVLGERKRVLDLACGIGYGSAILADHGHNVMGIDRDKEAIEYGLKHYRRADVVVMNGDAGSIVLEADSFEAAVCFETIEHIEDPLPMLKALHKAAPVLIASVPNEAVFPHGGRVKFHYRHYTKDQFQDLLQQAGYEVTAWYGQAGPESEVALGINGRTLIAVARRASTVTEKPARSLKVVAPANVPDHVAIIGLGQSSAAFFEVAKGLGGASAYCDEVWGINAIGDALRCDRIFHMDDLRIQEARAAERPGSNIAAMVKWLKTHPGPVYTSVVREGYPGLVAFPLQDVLNGRYDTNGGAPYFNSTAAYAIAYAVHIGVKRISLFGIDYTMPNAHQAEKGRACCEFWLGIASARGIEVTVPETTSLLDACEPEEQRLYGYDCVDVTLRDCEAGLEVIFSDKAEIPTAAEIEKRYDHKKHPNPLMQGKV